MPNPAAVAAGRIGAMLLALSKEARLYEELILNPKGLEGEIQTIIEEEFWGRTREEHHGPKQGDYMRKALKAQ